MSNSNVDLTNANKLYNQLILEWNSGNNELKVKELLSLLKVSIIFYFLLSSSLSILH